MRRSPTDPGYGFKNEVRKETDEKINEKFRQEYRKRLDLLQSGKRGLTIEDRALVLARLTEALNQVGGDDKDKAFQKDAIRTVVDLLRNELESDESERIDPLEQDLDELVELVHCAFEAEAHGSDPEALARLDQISAAHQQRLLQRERQEGIAVG
ncbi:MAG: hypothetical protein WC683_05860 [bacterium]